MTRDRQGSVTPRITWHAIPATPAQLAAWRKLWARLLGHVDTGQETLPYQGHKEGEASTIEAVSGGEEP